MNEVTTTNAGVLKLLGAREALGAVAGRCSAADAGILRDLRDNKRYLGVTETWDDFCTRHVHISKRHANRLIALLNEFGPAYFALAQITGITPKEFRDLKLKIEDNQLHFRGEAIALIEQNAGRLSEAVDELREIHSPGDRAMKTRAWKKMLSADETLAQGLKMLWELVRNPPEWFTCIPHLQTVRIELDEIERVWNNRK